jgi:hypothetical protein
MDNRGNSAIIARLWQSSDATTLAKVKYGQSLLDTCSPFHWIFSNGDVEIISHSSIEIELPLISVHVTFSIVVFQTLRNMQASAEDLLGFTHTRALPI